MTNRFTHYPTNTNALPYVSKPATPTSQPPTPPIVVITSKGTFNMGTAAIDKLVADMFQKRSKEGN